MARNNRERLIREGARLFHSSGYHGTSLDDILEATHVAKSNFYYHFKSKDELAVAVAEYWAGWIDEAVVTPALSDESSSPWTRLEDLFERAAAAIEEGTIAGSPAGELGGELGASVPEVGERVRSFFADLESRVAAVLAEAEDTWMDEGQARAIAGTIVATLEGGLLLAGVRGDAAEVRISGLVLIALIRNAWRAG